MFSKAVILGGAMGMVEDKFRAAAHVIRLCGVCILWTPFQFSSYHHGIGFQRLY